MITQTQAIKALLSNVAREDLSNLYCPEMECQVNVAQDDGEPIEGEFQGIHWRGYTDNMGNVWKPFRIPYNAMHEPSYDEKEMKFDLSVHAEGVGMTGWDWKNKCSKWVAFDFDAIVGHSDKHASKLDQADLRRVRAEAQDIPWVTVRTSTGGRGLHLYVFLDDVPTSTHTEHAALARAILSKLSALTGFDFSNKVDVCGGNMWVWHRKMTDDGLILIKQGDTLEDIPVNWRDHINVVSGRTRKVKQPFKMSMLQDKFDDLSNRKNRIRLEGAHRDLIKWLDQENKFFWWDQDNHMLVTHTRHLEEAHKELNYVGIFKTTSPGTNLSEQNCFAFPMRRGSWVVRRFTPGTGEHPSWEQDGQQWTRCYFNREPDLRTAALAYGGLEDPKGGYLFYSGSEAVSAGIALGANIDIPAAVQGRSATLRLHKDGKRIVVEVPYEPSDNIVMFKGWLNKRGTKVWTKIFGANLQTSTEVDMEDYDDVIRHLVTSDSSNAGWSIFANESWIDEPLEHVKSALRTFGLSPNDIQMIVGSSIFKPWELVVKPFEPEYPGGRQWNRSAPQFSITPSTNETLKYPTWQLILHHIGQSLDHAINDNYWCKQCGIKTGADWLKCWIAAMFQCPLEPLPYLFIYSDNQNTGKSILHEALSLLFKPGYCRADQALLNQSAFNGELEGAILCVVEETNLKANKTAYDRIKDWVTARELPIHRKMMTPYHVPNTTHWIQCANSVEHCPIFPNDTRITMLHVPLAPVTQIPKTELINMLEKEASDFLAAVLRVELPPTTDRLRLPCVETSDKLEAAKANRSDVLNYLEERCHFAPGYVIRLSDLYENFLNSWVDPKDRLVWSKQKFTREVPDKFPKGRLTSDSQFHFGNISYTPAEEIRKAYKRVGEYIRDDYID